MAIDTKPELHTIRLDTCEVLRARLAVVAAGALLGTDRDGGPLTLGAQG